ncbi:probable 28S ribosomal protein S26, mitochondrial [Haliotis rufescens]|uniref:probable 28S ribosomal protein S26, mitochondrial n=1 Tax=Haliotis rufescens TaxID=6454 RepID=UPI00201E78F7|nr:probable 28S ribosomal protein S26, mitochondrial [Haliotis rufescens]
MAGMSFLAAVVRSQNFVTLKIVTQELPKLASCYQTVRWRKSRWHPVTASKKFYVPKPQVFHPEDTAEVKKRLPIYNTHLRAVRNFITKTHQADLARRALLKAQQTDEEEEFAWIMEENNKWNAKVAAVRESRQKEEFEKIQARLDRQVERRVQRKQKQEAKAHQLILANIEESKYFITEDNLDQEIEKLLNSRKDYNFAIDSSGKEVTDFDNATPPLKDSTPKGETDSQS